MRKTIAILLLVVQTFNFIGCLVLYQLERHRTELFFEKQADKGLYNKGELVEVKIPVSLPNITDWAEYESVSGQVQFDDHVYNYTQLRITRHALYLKCVPNYDHTHYLQTNVIHAGGVKHVPVPKKDHVPSPGYLLVQSLNVARPYTIEVAMRYLLKSIYYPYDMRPSDIKGSVPEQPPKNC